MEEGFVNVFIKLLSGDIIPLSVSQEITRESFYKIVYKNFKEEAEKEWSLYKFIVIRNCGEEKEESIIDDNDKNPLFPFENEFFCVFLNIPLFSVDIELKSTECFEDYKRYELYNIIIKITLDNVSTSITQQIYTVPLITNAVELYDEFEYFLADNVIAHRGGRFGDEWDIEIPKDIKKLHLIEELVYHSDRLNILLENEKEKIKYVLIDTWKKYIDREHEEW